MAKKCTTIQNTLCIAILLLIKPFVWWISCCCHGLLKLPVVLGWGQWENNPIFPSTHLWKRVAVGGKMTVLNNLLIWWPRWTSNEELRGQVRQQPIGQEIRQRDWGWIGNTLKRPDRYPAKRATEGKRKRSRPQHTWRYTWMAELEKRQVKCKEVKCTAQNRVRWWTPANNLCSIRNEMKRTSVCDNRWSLFVVSWMNCAINMKQWMTNK